MEPLHDEDLVDIELLIVGYNWTLRIEPRRSVSIRFPNLIARKRCTTRRHESALVVRDLPRLLAVLPKSLAPRRNALIGTLQALGDIVCTVDPFAHDELAQETMDSLKRRLDHVDPEPLLWMGAYSPDRSLFKVLREDSAFDRLLMGRLELSDSSFLAFRLDGSRVRLVRQRTFLSHCNSAEAQAL